MDGSTPAKTFAHALGAQVSLKASGETGEVKGRAEYAHSENTYYIEYRTAQGVARTDWWSESSLTAA